MIRSLKGRLSYANVASTLALVIALGGGGAVVAASMVPNNSVGSGKIINNSVRSIDLKDNGVRGTDVNEGTLGQVPSAVTANTADTANNAITANSAATANSLTSGAITSPGVFGTGNLGIVRGYAWNNLINTNGDLTANGYSYNRSGGPVSVSHSSAGVYTITFTGLNIGGGNVVVSSYGGGAVWCKVGGWSGSAATVLCFNSAGAATDSLWTIAMTD